MVIIQMAFADKLRKIRLEKDMSLSEFADLLGTSKQVLSRYERGDNTPKITTVQKYAEILNVPLSYLTDETFCISENISQMPSMKKWNVIGATACGSPLHKEFDGETVIAPAGIDADFVFRCEGDSMIGARVLDGDIVFVKRCEVENGKIAVVRIGDEYTLKRIYRGPDYLELRAENPK